MVGKNKEVLINIRLKPETREEFRIAAELRGASMSGLLHQFIVKTIREEKERDPQSFENIDVPSVIDEIADQEIDPRVYGMQNKILKRFLRSQEEKSDLSDTPNLTVVNEDSAEGIKRED
jgi:hypothetical protein